MKFLCLFYVKGLCWPLYNPRISCNAIAGVVWTVNNDHDTTNTPTKLKFFEENKRKEMKWRMKEFIDFNFQWMDSDYIIRTVFTHSRLYLPKCVNHPVESQQMGWKMMFLDYIIRNALKQSGFYNPNCISTKAEAICFGWASVLEQRHSTVYDFDQFFKQKNQFITLIKQQCNIIIQTLNINQT